MNIWKNTTILDDYSHQYNFINKKNIADIILLGSRKITVDDFPKLKAVFRAGVGRDNIPSNINKDIQIVYPSKQTMEIVYDETSNYTCNLIINMSYQNVGTVNPWNRRIRKQFSRKTLLVVGCGNIGSRVANKMKSFLNVVTFDNLHNEETDLKEMIRVSDYISLHIPGDLHNKSFFDSEKLSLMKNGSIIINTSRGSIVNENDLYNELKTGRIKAFFDVFWNEPYSGKLMEYFPKYFRVSPHVSSSCYEFINSINTDFKKFLSNLS